VVVLYSTESAFAALKSTRKVIVWGNSSQGGTLSESMKNALSANVVSIYSSLFAFTALTSSKTIYSWGAQDFINNPIESPTNLDNILTIFPNSIQFAGIKTTGEMVRWGILPPPEASGDGFSAVVNDLSKNIIFIGTSLIAYSALKTSKPINLNDYYYSTGATKLSKFMETFIVSPISANKNLDFANIDVGDNLILSPINISGGIAPLSYQWYSSSDNINYSTMIFAANSSLILFNNGTYTNNTVVYYKLKIFDLQNNSTELYPYKITYLSPLTGTLAASSPSVVTGTEITLTASSAGGTGNYTYEWYEVATDGTRTLLNTTNNSNYIIENNVLKITNTNQYINTTLVNYKCVIKNK
jgi:hypothetical protein